MFEWDKVVELVTRHGEHLANMEHELGLLGWAGELTEPATWLGRTRSYRRHHPEQPGAMHAGEAAELVTWNEARAKVERRERDFAREQRHPEATRPTPAPTTPAPASAVSGAVGPATPAPAKVKLTAPDARPFKVRLKNKTTGRVGTDKKFASREEADTRMGELVAKYDAYFEYWIEEA